MSRDCLAAMKVYPPLVQFGVAYLLHHKIASEATGRLDEDRPYAVAFDPLQHGREASTAIDGIGAAHRRVVELVY
jgi:hypothetical protein